MLRATEANREDSPTIVLKILIPSEQSSSLMAFKESSTISDMSVKIAKRFAHIDCTQDYELCLPMKPDDETAVEGEVMDPEKTLKDYGLEDRVCIMYEHALCVECPQVLATCRRK